MKQILDLLNQLDKKSMELYSVKLFGDFSGHIYLGENEIVDFNNKKECIKELKQLLK